MSFLKWVLGTELGSSERASCALNHWVISLVTNSRRILRHTLTIKDSTNRGFETSLEMSTPLCSVSDTHAPSSLKNSSYGPAPPSDTALTPSALGQRWPLRGSSFWGLETVRHYFYFIWVLRSISLMSGHSPVPSSNLLRKNTWVAEMCPQLWKLKYLRGLSKTLSKPGSLIYKESFLLNAWQNFSLLSTTPSGLRLWIMSDESCVPGAQR